MLKFVGSYVVIEIVILVCAVFFTLWARRRRLRTGANTPPPGFVRTEETFIDPTTGLQQRVWFHPRTGKRYYETLGKDSTR